MELQPLCSVLRVFPSSRKQQNGWAFNGDCEHHLLDRIPCALEANDGVGKVCIHAHALGTRKLEDGFRESGNKKPNLFQALCLKVSRPFLLVRPQP